MKEQKKHNAEMLKIVTVENHEKKTEMAFILMKDTYEGVTVYRVYSMLKKDGGSFDIKDTEDTHDERAAKHYFCLLVSTYLRKEK